MKTVAVRNIIRTDSGLAARLGDAGASAVHEAQGRAGDGQGAPPDLSRYAGRRHGGNHPCRAGGQLDGACRHRALPAG